MKYIDSHAHHVIHKRHANAECADGIAKPVTS